MELANKLLATSIFFSVLVLYICHCADYHYSKLGLERPEWVLAARGLSIIVGGLTTSVFILMQIWF